MQGLPGSALKLKQEPQLSHLSRWMQSEENPQQRDSYRKVMNLLFLQPFASCQYNFFLFCLLTGRMSVQKPENFRDVLDMFLYACILYKFDSWIM